MSSVTSNILKWLGFAESVETAVLQNVPVANFGAAGNIIGIALVAEELAGTFLQDLNTVKQAASASATTASAPAPSQISATVSH